MYSPTLHIASVQDGGGWSTPHPGHKASTHQIGGYDGGTVVKVLRYKSEGRWFDSRWCHWNFSLTYPSDLTMALGSTQSLTEMSTRNISWG
jgi:hypothetical protein